MDQMAREPTEHTDCVLNRCFQFFFHPNCESIGLFVTIEHERSTTTVLRLMIRCANEFVNRINSERTELIWKRAIEWEPQQL